MHNLLLRMLMRGHDTSGVQLGNHLVDRFSMRHRLTLDAGANLNPGVFVFHTLQFTSMLSPVVLRTKDRAGRATTPRVSREEECRMSGREFGVRNTSAVCVRK